MNPKSKMSFAQGQLKCYCCGEDGHGANKCPKQEKIPRDQCYANKAISNLQGKDKRTDKEEKDKAEEPQEKTKATKSTKSVAFKKGWSTLQYCIPCGDV